jgi:serine/threonine-protein kinase
VTRLGPYEIIALLGAGGMGEVCRARDSKLGREVALNPAISPDGRWLLYQSNESGRDEVYVRPFPNVEGGRGQASTNGRRIPRWTSNGREILFVGNPGGWWIAPVAAGAAFSAGPPRAVVAPGPTASNVGMNTSMDGKRFIAVQRDARAAINRINIVLN